MSCHKSYCRGKTDQPRSMNASSPYSYADPVKAPQLPTLSQREWYRNRDQMPPPEIGFKFEILNFANEEYGRAPYPETDKFPTQPDEPSYPSGDMNTLSSSSLNRLTDYGDDENFGSDIEDEGNTSSSFKGERILTPSRSHKVDNELHVLPQNVAKFQGCRHRPVANGCEHQSGTPYAHNPTEALGEAKGIPRDRSSGAFYQYNG